MTGKDLYVEVLRHIYISSDIEFAWSENKDIFRHTAIVLKFDGIPVFTIDYGQEGGYLGSSGSDLFRFKRPSGSSHQVLGASSQASGVVGALLLPGSKLRVNGIEHSEIGHLHIIADFLLNSSKEKQFVIGLMMKIAGIKMSEYSVSKNNCRDFVKNAAKVIKAALKIYCDHSGISKQEFQRRITRANKSICDLKEVKKHDKRQFFAIVTVLAAVVSLSIVVAAVLLK